MKRYTSAAGLAVKLTWRQVAVYILALCFFQWVAFLNVNNAASHALEYRLDNWPMGIGGIGITVMVIFLSNFLGSSKVSSFKYTLKRLSLSEKTVTAVWALVFAGWFLLYWAVQIAMMFGMYANYVSAYGGSENLLFVVAMRSKYFHHLLPLYEPLGFIRNIAMCLAYGSFTALGAQNYRNGRSWPLFLFIISPNSLIVPRPLANQWMDCFAVVCIIVLVIWDWIWTERWMRNEEA